MSDLEGVEVIDWDEAMQQCGDDEEFLRELLGDLREETDSQMATMADIVENPTDNPFVGIVRAAHVIKGAASNLMCEQLRKTAMDLESTAANASSKASKEKDKDKDKKDAAPGKFDPEQMEIVKKKLENLKVAVKNYHEYLEEVDV